MYILTKESGASYSRNFWASENYVGTSVGLLHPGGPKPSTFSVREATNLSKSDKTHMMQRY